MTTLIKDLIDLPSHVGKGDFVLQLSRGVERPDETVRNYVVTPQLAARDSTHIQRSHASSW